jgi:hypothetical protein
MLTAYTPFRITQFDRRHGESKHALDQKWQALRTRQLRAHSMVLGTQQQGLLPASRAREQAREHVRSTA